MLYILSKINSNEYVVKDTDDNVESTVNIKKLKEAWNLGIEIKGVSVINGVLTAVPYEPCSDVTLTKLKVLKNVKLEIEGGILKDAYFVGNHEDDLTLRLSDYCHSIESHAIGLYPNDETVTLILDDKITFAEKAFVRCFDYDNIALDITEVKNETLIHILHDEFIQYIAQIDLIDRNIERDRKFICRQIMENGSSRKKADFDILQYDDYVFNTYEHVFNYFKDVDIKIRKLNTNVPLNTDFYKHRNNYHQAFTVILSATMIQSKPLKILFNYIKFFDKHSEVRQIYYDLVRRFIAKYKSRVGGKECYTYLEGAKKSIL